MTTSLTENYPVGAFDPEFLSFAQWLSSRTDDDVSGALAQHFLARGFLPGALNPNGTFCPAVTLGSSLSPTSNGSERSWAGAAPGAAIQALALRSFDALKISVLNFGPACSLDQYNAALAAFNAS